MAIVVVGLTGAIVAPFMVISVATRVQNQRAEQALELAQSEIDRVRVEFEQSGANENFVPVRYQNAVIAEASITCVGDEYCPAQVAGPTSIDADNTVIDHDGDGEKRVDINGDGTDDFFVQGFLVQRLDTDSDSIPNNYELGVRVYDIRAAGDFPVGGLATDEALVGVTSSEGERTAKPLSVVYTSVGISEDADSLCNWIDYTNASNTAPSKPATCN
jgi:type II secretory pathway pseudopilin PulG